MKLELYSGPLSLFTAKVRIALAEKSLPYERIEVGWSLADRYLPHHPRVAALNPKAQVPVLVDGDFAVYDSTVILEYLEDLQPEPPLMPADAQGRARCRQLEAAADEIVFPSIWDCIEESFYPADEAAGGEAGGGKRDAERLKRAHAALRSHHDGLERELAVGGDYLCGQFSIADIGTFVMVNAGATLGVAPDAEHVLTRAWIERMMARPAVATEVGEMTAYVGQALVASSSS